MSSFSSIESGELPESDTNTDSDINKPTPVKTQVLPLVYIQTQAKLPFTSITQNSSNNMVSQIQIATLPTNIMKPSSNQSVILAPMKKQLVIHKPGAGTYLTMLKPLSNTDTPISSPSVEPHTNSAQYVIAPMGLNNSSQNSNLAFMPLTIPVNGEGGPHSMFNIKISEEQPDEIIDLASPNKSEKEYELSIVEETKPEVEATPKNKRKDSLIYMKHGISILKKRNSSNNNHLVLDSEIDVEPVKVQKSERRRKSNFAYRKDYDDMEVVEETNNVVDWNLESADMTVTKLEGPEPSSGDDKKDFVEIEVTKEVKPDINMNDDRDLQQLLKWEEGFGSLPGSDIKFVINEFNIVEYLSVEDYDNLMKKKLEKPKASLPQDYHCVECGCFGLASDFITTQYCSIDCQVIGHKKRKIPDVKIKKKRKRGFPLKKTDSTDEKLENQSDESMSYSPDKYSYPWTCSKKGFSWNKYLEHLKVKAAPVKLFKDPFPYNRNGFKTGMKLEGVDPLHPSHFCVLSVSSICGYRVRLHFDGYPVNYDFWVNADSMDIFPVGWCEKYGHVLQTPPGHSVDDFNWVTYLKRTKGTAAPKHLFANRTANAICPNGFRVGMKLEAVDKKDNTLVCVATIRDMMDTRILVHFDSWDDIYDYWADPTSPYIHPVGWCDQYGHNLTPPNDYPNPETFSWEKYLKETKSVAAPVRAFKQRPACGFKRGMRLECVDKRVPQLIRVATVNEVRGHRLRIHFDGWLDRYSYCVDDDSADIHPVGWCQKTGHPIENPLTPDDVYDFSKCATVGCQGLGHIQGPKYDTHTDQKYCPYAEDNIDQERILPDRLLSPDRAVEAVVPVSREPKEKPKPRLGRPPKYLRQEDPIKIEPEEEPPAKKRKYRKRLRLSAAVVEDDESNEQNKAMKLIEESKVEPANKETWPKHSRFLNNYVGGDTDVRFWNEERVARFVSIIPGCEDQVESFKSRKIDGEALLALNKSDLITILGIKVGPAIKLYNIILLLRQKCQLF